MKTIITLDKANQPYGFPQLNGNGNLSNIIVESGLTATTLTMTGLTSNTSDPNLLSIDTNGVVHEYPISSFSGGSVNSVTAGSGLSGNTTTGNITLINTDPDQTVVITGGTNIQIVSGYPNFGINFTGTTSSAFTGGTVNGATNFTNGLTANTISATTYYNLPTYISATTLSAANVLSVAAGGGSPTTTTINAVTGGTYSSGTITLSGTGGVNGNTITGFPTLFPYLPLSGGTVTGGTIFQSGVTANTISATTYYNLPTDIRVTGGTYTNGTATFRNNTGGTFDVSGFSIGGGGGQIFYLNLSQSQNGNRLLSTTASTASEQTSGVTIGSSVTGSIASFQTTPLNISLIPGGIWSFYLHSYKEDSNSSFNIFVEVYKITSGGSQTLLFATDPAPVTTNSPNPSMQLTDGYFSGTSLNVSDGVVAVVKATNTNNQSHSITLVTEGSQHYSYVVSTIPTQQGLTCETLSGCSIIQTINTDISNKFDKSGGTVSGATNFTSGLTANTISATTYYNVNAVTGGTYSSGTITLSGTGSVNGNTITGLNTGTVTSITSGTGMSFSNITTSGSVSIDTAKVPYYSSTPSNGLLKYTSGTWGIDTSTYLTSAITSLGGLTGATQTFGNDTNVTMVSSGTIHTLTWSGTLADARIASATNWNTAYTNRITTLTVTGNSGNATLSSNTLNIPTYTLSGLGGQPLSTNLSSLSGLTYASTSFVKMTASGTFGLDTNTYLTSAVTAVTLSSANVLSVASTNTSATTTTVNAVTGGTYSNGTITLSGTGSVNGTQITGFSTGSSFTGGTVSGATNFTGGVTANTLTVSAATDPVKFVGLQSTTTDTSLLSVDNTGVVHTVPLFTWNNATTATTATTSNGYVGTATTLTTITLPTGATFGSVIEVVGTGTGLWRISQNANQFIKFGITGTTTGTGGYLSATSQYDCVKLLCTSADTTFVVTSAIGNIFYN